MAEKRWIDANALLELYDIGAELEDYAGTLSVPVPVIRLNIRDMPTVDAVEVVRCKDCKHCDWYTKTYESTGLSETKYWCTAGKGPAIKVSAEHFCSYGERRTDD